MRSGVFRVPKIAIVIDVKNRQAIAKSLETLVDWGNRTLRTAPSQSSRVSLGEIQRLKSQDAGYVFSLNAPPDCHGDPPGRGRPCCWGRKTLVIASSPAMAIQARDRNEGSLTGGLPAGDPLARSLESLPSGLTLLSIDDTAQSILPELVVGLPGLVESVIQGQSFPGLPFLRSSPFQIEEQPAAGSR